MAVIREREECEMRDVDTEVRNLETLIKSIEDKQEKPVTHTFLDLNEPEILDNEDYERMAFHKYAYAVKTVDDSF